MAPEDKTKSYGLLHGMRLESALRLATVAAGLSTQRFGGRPSTPELAAVMKELGHE